MGFDYVGPVDGHDVEFLRRSIRYAREQDCPVLLHVKTVKGKGVSFMEDQAGWHGKAPSQEQAVQAMAELGGTL